MRATLRRGLATFILAKAIANERVGAGARQAAAQHSPALGAFVACSRCVGVWIALALTLLEAVAPHTARILFRALAAAAINDYAQAGFAWVRGAANTVERPPTLDELFDQL